MKTVETQFHLKTGVALPLAYVVDPWISFEVVIQKCVRQNGQYWNGQRAVIVFLWAVPDGQDSVCARLAVSILYARGQ